MHAHTYVCVSVCVLVHTFMQQLGFAGVFFVSIGENQMYLFFITSAENIVLVTSNNTNAMAITATKAGWRHCMRLFSPLVVSVGQHLESARALLLLLWIISIWACLYTGLYYRIKVCKIANNAHKYCMYVRDCHLVSMTKHDTDPILITSIFLFKPERC